MVETGLGGRLDSTNVVRPFLSVITPIGFDHVEYLGYTITVDRRPRRAGSSSPESGRDRSARPGGARDADLDIAAQRRSPRMHDRSRLHVIFRTPRPIGLTISGLGINMKDVELALAGPFQHENAAIALAALEALRATDGVWMKPQIRRGLRRSDLAGTLRRGAAPPAGDPGLRA